MNYQETIAYLYSVAPLFQQVGGKAYKEGLENTRTLDAHFGHPHKAYRTIHVAGTNGKGSCSHTLAAILQEAGYRVGLYTSPHLVDFRERIRINGVPMPEACLVRFVEKERTFFEPLYPSFFELTTALAFRYFADEEIDVAVIEVGLGGRLDCTNIIRPEVSIITNISFDHTQFLGNTLAKIAAEKAGIIKTGIPVVIGETTEETRPVFAAKAKEEKAPIVFAEEEQRLAGAEMNEDGYWAYRNKDYPDLRGELGGLCQLKNTNTLLSAMPLLKAAGFHITEKDVRNGFAQVCELTGLMGRWQKLQSHPTLMCDTGHNVGGMAYICEQLRRQTYRKLHIVIGMVNDKDIRGVLALLPKEAEYYFTKANVKRALPEEELEKLAVASGLKGKCYPDVPAAVRAAQEKSLPEDFIFVGGSSFIVADLLTNRDALHLD
ncbi:folylpolyglutamate synthase/dihydrofolate synthase family protein [uncultured Bacteroides sp.]|uniref:bifunctional folylpolyglutamate synthase/dihydrofolate synthase n=1 Tax=uncultured Bacteroides sp. TaxID=162156 RepID=UPI002AA85E1B|nr:folylpolyglutamate synthase/dihydrofolate synthase family protein [uncultured Bacteroides sp.]